MTLQETLTSIAKSELPLQGKLDALKSAFEGSAPPAIVEVLHRATDELIASGAQNRALKAGDIAPGFTPSLTLTAIPFRPRRCSPEGRWWSPSIAAPGARTATST